MSSQPHADTLASCPDGAILGDDLSMLSTVIETQQDIAAVELDQSMAMRVIVERVSHITRANGAMIEMLHGPQLVCEAAVGVLEQYVGIRFDPAGSFSGAALTANQVLTCDDVQYETRTIHREIFLKIGVRSIMVVPLQHCGKRVGVLKVTGGTACAFGPRHAVAMKLMAGLLGAVLSHAAEFEDKKRLLAERTHALAALRESEDRFRSAFDHAPIGIALVGLDGRWLQVNQSICDILGYRAEELLAIDFQTVTHPDDLDGDLALVKRLIKGEIPHYQLTKRYIHRNGRLVWVLLSVSLVRDPEGKPAYFIAQVQDVSQQREAEAAMRKSEADFRAAFESGGVGRAQADPRTGLYTRVNAYLCQMLGYTPQEMYALRVQDVTHPDDRTPTYDAWKQIDGGEVDEFSLEKRYLRKDGSALWVSVNATLIRDEQGQPLSRNATILDITERKQSQWLEQDRRQVLEMVARDMPLPDVLDALAQAIERQVGGKAAVLVNLDGTIRVHGSNLPLIWREALTQRPLSVAAQLSASCVSQDGDIAYGITDVQHDPVWEPVASVAAACQLRCCWTVRVNCDLGALGVVTVFQDKACAPDRNQAQALDLIARLASICLEHHNTTRQLSHLVRHDALTGLPNRILFEDRVQHALASSRRTGNLAAVMVLDVDKFKTINDTLGHHAGDAILQQFASRLRGRLRETDTLARVGGDEFVLVLPELTSADNAIHVARKLVSALKDPFEVAGRTLQVTTSIGIALYPTDADDAVSLQKKADAALYRAKQNGRNQYAF